MKGCSRKMRNDIKPYQKKILFYSFKLKRPKGLLQNQLDSYTLFDIKG